jgi:hypothetical protein
MMASMMSPGDQCRAAIERAERAHHIPRHLLAAIGRVESGRPTPAGGVDPWPYSINVDGADTVFDTKAAAIAGARTLLRGGARSIDVGCLQVNLMYHPDAFASLEDAFDPWSNADYGARFLVRLRDETGSWTRATASYHSATPELGGPYAAESGRAAESGLAADLGAEPGADPRIDPGAGGRGGGPAMGALSPIGRPALSMPPPSGRARMTAGGGRGLDAYRSHPVLLAGRLFQPGPPRP